MKIVRSRQAELDLIDIWIHVSKDSVSSADRLIDQLEDKLKSIATFPLSGASRDDIRPGFRMLVAGEYLILHRVLDGEVEVVRIVHGRRDLGEI